MLASQIGDAFALHQQVSAIDAKIAAIKGALQNVNVMINGRNEGLSATEAVAGQLLTFYTNKRTTVMASLIARGYEDG